MVQQKVLAVQFAMKQISKQPFIVVVIQQYQNKVGIQVKRELNKSDVC